MKIRRKLALVAAVVAALACSAAPALADIVTVTGTAAGFYSPPDPTYLAATGLQVDADGSFAFTYSFDTATASKGGPGSLTLISRNAGGSVIDTVDLPSTTVWSNTWSMKNGFERDDYTGGALTTRNGVRFQIGVDLVERQGLMLASDPGPNVYLNTPWPEMYLGLGVDSPDCAPMLCLGFVANITSLSATVMRTDADGDGVADSVDKCLGSGPGTVDANGCTLAQLVPCKGPAEGGTWKDHGTYVARVTKVAETWLAAGLITKTQKDALVAAASTSPCGRK